MVLHRFHTHSSFPSPALSTIPSLAAKEERLRKLESELQLKQDLLVAKGNEVSSLEATVAASTATNDALCSEKDGLQAELRRYRLVGIGWWWWWWLVGFWWLLFGDGGWWWWLFLDSGAAVS